MGKNNTPTFSYHANRSVNDTNVGRYSSVDERNKQRSKLYSLLRHLPVMIASLVIVACIINELILSNSPRIILLSSTNGKVFLQDSQIYQKAAAALFGKSVFNGNKLTVDVNGISSSLKNTFPELQDVSITLPILGHKPIVYIESSDPALALSEQNGIFLVNNTGKALILVNKNSPLLNDLHLVLVTDQSGLRVSIGQTILPSTTVNFIQTITNQLMAQNIKVSSVILPAKASEVDVYITGTSYYGKFNTQEQGSALQQVGTFIAVYKQLAKHGITPTQYIDVRINGRAYYK
jgi:hypothetical protein